MMPNDDGVGADGRGAAMRALFDAAIGHGPEDRTAFLRETARRRGVDDELIDEVVGLLAFVEATRIDENAVSDADAPDRLVGCRLGAFTLDRLVGIGGTAAVFEATQDRPRRTVAVKVLRQGIAGPRARRRFEREIEIAGRLEHPAIARVLDSGTMRVDGFDTPWLAMEFVPDARTITRYAREANLDLRDRIALVRSALAGVAAAHRRGIIHRDLKPANVLVDGKGRIRVIDFGIARQSGGPIGAMTATVPGQVIGTVPFMAPEQLDGDSDAVDVRTDVYAIGVTLHLLLTGRMPYETSDCSFIEAARRIREVEIGSLRRLERTIDRDLDGIVQKALAKSADARYPSIDALDADLAAWLEHRPVTARPLGSVARFWRLTRSHPLPSALAAAATVSVLLTIVILAVMLDRESKLRAEGDRASANAGIAAAAAAIDRGDASGAVRHLAMVPDGERGWAYDWLHSRVDRSDAVLELGKADVISIDVLPAHEGHARPSLLLITSYRGTFAFELPDLQWRWHLPEFSKGGSWKHTLLPDGERFVVCGLGPELILANLDTGAAIARVDTPGSIGAMHAIDDSTVLLGGDDGVLSRLDLDSLEISLVAHLGDGGITSMLGLPGGRILISTARGGLLETDVTLATPKEIRRYPRMIARLRADREYERIAVCMHGGTLELLDAADFSTIHVFDQHDADVWDARFDEDGDRLVTASLDESVRVFDLTSFELVERLPGPHEFIWSLALEEDARHAWIGTHDGSVRRVALQDPPIQMPEGELAVGLAWSPEGTRLAVRTERGVRLLDRSSGLLSELIEAPRPGPVIAGSNGAIVWSQDAIWCDGGRRGGLWRVDPDAMTAIRVLSDSSVAAIAGVRDGGVVVTLSDESVHRISTQGDVVLSVSLDGLQSGVAVDARSREVHLLSHQGGSGTVLDLDNFEIRDSVRPYGVGPSFVLAISRDGTRLVAGSRERPGNVVSMENPSIEDKSRVRAVGHSGNVQFVGFIDGDQRLISAGDDGRVIVHRLDEVEPLHTVFEFDDRVRGLAISPSGRVIAVTDGREIHIADPDRYRRESR